MGSRYGNDNSNKIGSQRRMVNLKGQQVSTGQKVRNGGVGGSANNAGNHMDILKKFRYNFHYWLRNCYQGTDDQNEKSKDGSIQKSGE